ncbi:hypothetical protein [Bacillus safensis]|uniref:hypothetical protein n=1 Tax=Bacillus safensis TaxID=561879 RepID=UPI002E1B323C|nr:hypothetical protein [Bacillus safensis]
MKFVLSARSEMAFMLLNKLLKNENIPDLEVREQNAQSCTQLEDAIEFYKADLYIVDKQLENYSSLKDLLDEHDCNYVCIEDDVKTVIVKVREKLGLEEKIKHEQEEIVYEEKRPKEKIVIEEKIIEKEVIRTKFQAIPSKVIVVGSLWRGAGSTLVATNLARMIGERGIDTAYVEHPLIKPYMFDYLQIIADSESEYIDISREIQREGLSRSIKSGYERNKVKWHVIDSREPQLDSFTYENMLVLSHSITSNVQIVDISDRWLDPEIQKYLYLADVVLLCLEPDPIKYDWSLYDYDNGYVTKERKIMHFLNNQINQFEIINTKYNKGTDFKIWNEATQKRASVKLPYIPYADAQKALYSSKLLYDLNDYDEVFENAFLRLMSMAIPKDYVDLDKSRDKGFFQKVFRTK